MRQLTDGSVWYGAPKSQSFSPLIWPFWVPKLGHIQMYVSSRCWVWNVKKKFCAKCSWAKYGEMLFHMWCFRTWSPACRRWAMSAAFATSAGQARSSQWPQIWIHDFKTWTLWESVGNPGHMWAPKIRVIGTSIQLSGWKQTHGKRTNPVVEGWDEHSWYVHMLWFNLGQWLSWMTEVLPLPQVCARWIASIPFASAAVGKWGPSAVPCVELHHGCTMAMSRTAERAAKGCTHLWCGVQQKYAD